MMNNEQLSTVSFICNVVIYVTNIYNVKGILTYMVVIIWIEF